MNFPLGDWQFWVVSIIALAGLFVVLKPLWPSRDRTSCGGCNAKSPAKNSRRVRLTLGRTDPPGK